MFLPKLTSTILLIALIFCGLASVSGVHFASAQASTNLIISSDTTWTQTNSPYNLGNILVENGVTLTIQSGTTINFNDLEVNGTLYAVGNSSNPIRFNGAQIIFTPYSNGWNEATGSGSIISGAVLIAPISITSSSPMISNSNISYMSNPIDISGGSPILSGNFIRAVSYGDIYGRLQTTDNGILLNGNNGAIITDNVLSEFQAAIVVYGGSPLIQRNVIQLGGGIDLNITAANSNPTIQNNTFSFCQNAILAGSSSGELTLTLLFNNFENYSNSQYNVYWGATSDLNATYNWWGTTDQSAISNSIYDFSSDFNLGKVNFVPFLAIPNPNAPIPTPNLSPTSTSTPMPTSNASPSPTSTPIVPEFSFVIIIATVLLIAALSIAVYKGKLLLETKNKKGLSKFP